MTTLAIENQQTTRYGLVFAANLTSQQSKNLSDASFRLWIILHTYSPANPGDGWTVGAERLADDAGFSRSTFFRALAQLKEQKLVMVHNKKASGRANRYVLVNATGIKTLLGGLERGVNSDSPEFDSSHSSDTGGGSTGDTQTGAFTGATNSNNPPIPPKGEPDLTIFLGGLLDKLFCKLATMDDYEQCQFLLREHAYDYAMHSKQGDWDVRAVFKRICIETDGNDAICYELHDKINEIARPESGRKRSANKRRAFLTECQNVVREYGRQL